MLRGLYPEFNAPDKNNDILEMRARVLTMGLDAEREASFTRDTIFLRLLGGILSTQSAVKSSAVKQEVRQLHRALTGVRKLQNFDFEAFRKLISTDLDISKEEASALAKILESLKDSQLAEQLLNEADELKARLDKEG